MIARGLLPVYHADRLAEASLIARWACALGIFIAGSGALGVVLVAGMPAQDRRVVDGITENRRIIVESDAQAAFARAKAAAASKDIEAQKAVGEHPDWGLLIERLAGAAGSSVAIEEVVITYTPVETPKAPSGSVKPAPDSIPRRRWAVAASGIAPKQSTVAKVVAAIEAWGLFDRVKLVESKARTFGQVQAVGFKIEGVIEEGRR